MEIREVGDEDIERAVYIGRQAFALGDRGGTSRLTDPNRPPMKILGVWDEQGLQARLCILGFEVHLGPDTIVPMGGIGGVACLPASRGKGYAGLLMRHSLERMRDAGQAISMLFPFHWGFYQKLGWEWIGLHRTYRVPTRILPSHPETDVVRAATPEDRSAIVDCYTTFAGRYRGMLARSEKRWDEYLNDQEEQFAFTYLYEQANRVEGYLVLQGGKSDETKIEEFIALTPRARGALLSLLRRHETQTKQFVWNAPGDDPLYFSLCHKEVETKLEPRTQGRIVDLTEAVRAWKPESTSHGTVVLHVEDASAPWNAGDWRVEFDGGAVSVRRTDREPQVSLDIRALSQAYFGTPTVDEIRAQERLQVHDEAGYAAFRALFAGPPMWTADGF